MSLDLYFSLVVGHLAPVLYNLGEWVSFEFMAEKSNTPRFRISGTQISSAPVVHRLGI